MDALMESSVQADGDAEMTALTSADVAEKNLDASDEVEHLRNSLREVVHDDSVRPKMQCLMMDSTFSMVTMQGEDSGIAWETTPSRCTTPWASEAGTSTVDLSCPGSVPAGKIIFVMDEELISRRKKTKERTKQREILVQSSENISGRPELVGVSQPNVKPDDGDEEEPSDPQGDKEQQLFSLVAEGSEILNIVVPPKLATVDEEESGEMVDNLSYLEDSVVPKATKEAHDYEIVTVTTESVQVQVQNSPSSAMDPPGAPVARPPGSGAAGNVDYFEPFTLIDAQAPGSPAVATTQGEVEQEVHVGTETEEPEKPAQTQVNAPPAAAAAAAVDESDTISLLEITSELLDEVFYGGTDDYSKSPEQAGGVAEDAPSKLPSKPSGSTLFGSQEEILTPIFLPEGPPKIIDPILLEEPKAMAFLYTDLYEEAVGSRKKEEDAESVTSEKSFHSRHSDREARGYLEKYALIDETPVVEVESADQHDKEGPRMLSDDLYNFTDFLSKPGKEEMSNTEEEITDFFRSSANSSPCDIEPLSATLEEEEQPESAKKSKGTTNKNVSIKVEKAAENPVESLSISCFEFPTEEPEFGSTEEPPPALDVKQNPTDQEPTKKDLEVQKPVAPPRRKVASAPKTRLDLGALTPVEVLIQEKEEAAGKEQREEEKETASPAETADEGDGDGEETTQGSCNEALCEALLAAAEPLKSENVEDDNMIRVANPAAATEGKEGEEEGINQTERATTQTEPEEAAGSSSPSTKTEAPPESASSSAPEAAKSKAQCVIL
ncbi:uncharacterized protein V6R79_003755 [Siganus canaliculatus]